MNVTKKMYRKRKTPNNTGAHSIMQISKVDQTIHIGGKTIKNITIAKVSKNGYLWYEEGYCDQGRT